MNKVYLICGKICSGKSHYADRLRREHKAVILSVDEITLLLGQHLGDSHDDICDKVQEYLFGKSLEILEAGCGVILDWGFWQRRRRAAARDFYKSRGIPCEMHYVRVTDGVWRGNIAKRNRTADSSAAYYVDSNLAAKCTELFEEPGDNEVDVIYDNTGE